MLQGDNTLTLFRLMMETCINIMKYNFYVFGIKVSLWDIFLWAIVMYALLKLFFALFE